MPWVPDQTYDVPSFAPDLSVPEAPAPRPDPTFGETMAAAFRQDNTIGSFLSRKSIDNADPAYVEDGFDPWARIKGTPLEEHWDRFVDVHNSTAFEQRRSQIEMEAEDRRTVAASGWLGLAASFGAAVFDVPSLVPGGAIYRSAKMGATTLRSAVSVGAAAGVSAGLQEAALQGTQEIRPGSETAIAIGGSILLGGLLGGGASAYLSRADRRVLEGRIQSEVYDNAPLMADEMEAGAEAYARSAQPAGAAAVDVPTLDDLSIAGRAASATAVATAKLNPILRGLHSPSVAVREIAQSMMEVPIYLKKNMQGRATDPAVESLIKQYSEGATADAIDSMRKTFRDYRRGGGQLNYTDFRKRVGRAMRREDMDEEPAVAAVAKKWRDTVFEPLKQRAIEEGMLPPDVSVDTAASYFSRVYNTPKIEAQEGKFKGIVREWARSNVDKTVAKLTKTRDFRKSRLEQELADLQLSGEDRITALTNIESEVRTLRENSPALRNIDSKIRDLRTKRAKLKAEGKDAEADAALKEMQALRASGGEEYADFSSRLNAINARRLRIIDNIAGRATAVDRIRNQIADIDYDNIERLRRLSNGLRRIGDEIDFEESGIAADRLADYRAEFAEVLARSEQAADRLAKAQSEAEAAIAKAREGGASPDEWVGTDKLKQADEAQQKLAQRLQREETAERNRIERLNALSRRIEELEAYDPEEAARLLREAVEERLSQTNNRITAAVERMVELSKRAEALSGEAAEARVKKLTSRLSDLEAKFNERVNVGLDGANGYESYVDDIVESIFNQVTGRENTGTPAGLVAAKRGPMKERTFAIKDELIEEFLEDDIDLVGQRYARVMAADVELARKYGSPDMKDALSKVRDDYAKLRQEVSSDPNLTPAAKEKRLTKLASREKGDITDLQAVRDLLRGQYMPQANQTTYARALKVVQTFNYLRAMGGVVAGSLADAARPMMVHGLSRFMSDGVAPLVRNLGAVKMSVREAKLAGTITDRILNTRMATMAEITDPYSMKSPFERWIDNAARYFSIANGSVFWNDFAKSVASTMTQNRILENVSKMDAISDRERAYLAMLGMDRSMADRIARQFAEHGQTVDGVRIAGTEDWTDIQARRVYRAAIVKDVDSIIVTKGVGDVPLFAHTPTGRALIQFKSFALASHQRVLLRGLQESPASVLTGMTAAVAIGMFIYWLKSVESNRLEDLSDNPGRWIAEGLDRSGLFSIMFEVNNTWEKMAGAGIYSGLQAMFPGSQEGQASRYATRNITGSLVGPTSGLVEDFARLVGSAKQGRLTEGDVKAMRRLMPGGTLPVVRSLLEYGVMPAATDAVRN